MKCLNEKEKKFNVLCDEWLSYKRMRIKESTYSNYKFKIVKYLKKDFGEYTLKKFNNIDINRYIEDLQETLSDKTIKDIITVLKSILKYCERKYDIDFKLDLISVPTSGGSEVEIFNEKERNKIENYILNSNDLKEIGVLISMYSGLRIGEICALRWADIDFDAKKIRVIHTVQRIYLSKNNSKIIITSPKTKKSVREIPMAKILYKKLREFSKKYSKNDFVISGKDKVIEPLSYRYTYKKMLNNCNIQYKKFHCLRHTFATRCVRVGMDVKSLSEVLGHSNVSVTLGIYVHSSYEIKKKFIDKL